MPVVSQKQSNPDKKETILLLVSLPTPHTKSNSSMFELLSDPSDTDSIKYRMTILRLQGGEDARTLIQWSRDAFKLRDGLGITAGPAQFKVINTILSGTPQVAFEARISILATVTLNAACAAEQDVNARRGIRNAGWVPHITPEDVKAGIWNVHQRRHLCAFGAFVRFFCLLLEV